MAAKAKDKSNVYNLDQSDDGSTQQKLRGVNIDIEALRNAVRSVDSNHTQTLSLVSKLREELALEQSKVRRLELQMEEAMRYFKSGGRYNG